MSENTGVSRLARDGVPMTPGRATAEHPVMARAIRELGFARLLFAAGAWAFVGCVCIQVFLVGLDLFAHVDASVHRNFAYLYGWLVPTFVLLSRLPRVPRATRLPALILLVLLAAQTVMPSLRDDYPIVAALHPVNALAIFAVGVALARRASTGLRHKANEAGATSPSSA
jgi:hypothetical protein